MIRFCSFDATKKGNQISRDERNNLVEYLKRLPLTIIGALSPASAMVTGGGVSHKELCPTTMESKKIPGVFFCGEVIDGCAPSGGYNLQQAFSTGYLVGDQAARQ